MRRSSPARSPKGRTHKSFASTTGSTDSRVADPAMRPPPVQLSLLTPTRIPPPVSYQAPPRAAFSVPVLQDDASAHRELFNQLKSKVRSSTKAKLSDKSDFHMLASASKRSGDTSKAAQALYSLGVTHDNSRAFPKAIEAYRKFLRMTRESGDLYAQCLGFNSIAIAYHNLGDFGNALMYHARHAKVAPDARNQVVALCNAGLAQRKMGRIAEARDCCRSALEIAISASDSSGEMLASGMLGITSAAGHAPKLGSAAAPAASTAGAAAAPAAPGKATDPDAKKLTSVQAEVGRMALQRQLYLQSVEDDPRNRAVAHQQLGLLASASGDHDTAFEHFKQAREFSIHHHDTGRSMLDKCHMGIAAASQRMEEHFKELREKALAGAAGAAAVPAAAAGAGTGAGDV